MNSAESKEILLKEFEKMDKMNQNRLLNYAKKLSQSSKSKNIDNVLKLAGSISKEDIELMDKAIKEDCEQVDHDEW